MNISSLSNGNCIIIGCGVCIVILIFTLLFIASCKNKKEQTPPKTLSPETFQPTKVNTTLFRPVKKEIEFSCKNEKGEIIECGYSTKRTPLPYSKDFISELKLINSGPIAIDVYYRNGKGCRQMFVATIPRNKFVFSYEAEEGTRFRPGGQLFAKYSQGTCREGELLYLPLNLRPEYRTVCFGEADSLTLKSGVVVNLLGEIMFIEFHNHSNAVYDIYYYGDFIGTLDAVGTEGAVFRSNNSNKGYRLNSDISIVMKGSGVKQNFKLTNVRMDTMNIGRIRAYEK